KQLPGDLKGDEGLAGSGGESEKDARLFGRDRLEHAVDGDVLVIASLEIPALVLEGDGGEAVAPRICFGEGQAPQLVGPWKARQSAFLAGLHVDAIDALPVARIGEADGELAGIILRLRHAFGQGFVPGLGLDHAELVRAIFEDVIGDERLGAAAKTFDAAEGDRVFAPDAAAFDDAPARRLRAGSMCSALVSASFIAKF